MLLIAIAVVLLLVVLNGLFAMTELAVVSSRKSRLQSRAEKGDRGARKALKLSEEPTQFLSAVQVGITLIGILAGAYGQATIAAELDHILEVSFPALSAYTEIVSTALVVVCITYVSLIVGELVPKRLALIFPETIAAKMAAPISALAVALKPFVLLLAASTPGILKMLGVKDRGRRHLRWPDRARRTGDDRGNPAPGRPARAGGHDAAPRSLLDRPGRSRGGVARRDPHLPLFPDRGGA